MKTKCKNPVKFYYTPDNIVKGGSYSSRHIFWHRSTTRNSIYLGNPHRSFGFRLIIKKVNT